MKKSGRFGEIVRFCITGGGSAIVDFLICQLFLLICANLSGSWPIVISTTMGFLVSVIVNYLLSTFWVFKNVDKSVESKNAKFVIVFILLSAIGLFISIGVMEICERACFVWLNLDISESTFKEIFTFSFWGNKVFWAYFISFCLKILVGLIWNYFSRKEFLYIEPIKEVIAEDAPKSNKKGISICLLAYKEAENLKILLPKIIENVKKVEDDFEILVIDTKVPLDNTKEVCDSFENVRYINQRYPYFGGAFKTGIEEASKQYFLILDSDGSHDPIYIPNIYRKFIEDDCDVVIGSRYIEGGKTDDYKANIFMSKILNGFFKFFLHLTAKDCSTDYRMYRSDDLKALELKEENYNVLQEVLLKLRIHLGHLKMGESPIEFKKRMFGESKRRLLKFIFGYMRSLVSLYLLRIFKEKAYQRKLVYCFSFLLSSLVIFIGLYTTKLFDFAISSAVGISVGYLFAVFLRRFVIEKTKDNSVMILSILLGIPYCLIGILFALVFTNYMNHYLLIILSLIIVYVFMSLTYYFVSSENYTRFVTYLKGCFDKFRHLHYKWYILFGLIIIWIGVMYYSSTFIYGDSDYSNLILEAQDIIGGNTFLNGWIQTGLSFVTTDLLFFEFWTLFLGYNPFVLNLVTWSMYVITGILGFFLLKKDGKYYFRDCLLYFSFILVPSVAYLLIVRAHTPIYIYGFLALICLEKYLTSNKYRYLGIATFLCAFAYIGDPFMFVLFTFPALVYFAFRSIFYKGRKPYIIGAICLALSFLLGFIGNKVFYMIGGAIQDSSESRLTFNNPSEWLNILKNVISGGVVNFGRNNAILDVFVVINFILGYVAAIIAIVRVLINKKSSLTSFVLGLTLFEIPVIFILFDTYRDHANYRYIPGLLFVIAILIAKEARNYEFITKERLSKIRLSLYDILFVFALIPTIANITDYVPYKEDEHVVEYKEVAQKLLENDLKEGYAGFWDASVMTIYTNNEVKVRALICNKEHYFHYNFFYKEDWAYSQGNFILVCNSEDKGNFHITLDYTYQFIGIPQKQVDFVTSTGASYSICIYDHSLFEYIYRPW